jgi:hypothetical protein
MTARRPASPARPAASASTARPSTFALSVPSPAAAANSPAAGAPRRLPLPAGPDTTAPAPTPPSHPATAAPRLARHAAAALRALRPACPAAPQRQAPEHARDFLTGDHQPRDLLFRPVQLLDPAAQPVRLGPGGRLRALEFLDQRAHTASFPARDSRRPRPQSPGNKAKPLVASPFRTAAPNRFWA